MGGSKSASGYGPGGGGPNPRGVQIRCDTGGHSKANSFPDSLLDVSFRGKNCLRNFLRQN